MVDGFFSRKETQSKTNPDGRTYSCVSCKNLRNSKNPRMAPQGNFGKGILIINNYPSKRDDEKKRFLTGKCGVYLRRALQNEGIDLWEDCLVANAVMCVPFAPDEKEKPLSHYELACCRKSLIQLIDEKMPKLIFVLGDAGIISLLQHRWQGDIGNIHKWRGWTIPDQDFKAWICPVYHPDFVNQGGDEVKTIFNQDIHQALKKLDEPFAVYKKPTIEIINDLKRIREIKISTQSAVDYETTGIKPDAVGHRIISSSVTLDPDHALTFLMPDTKKQRQPFLEYLSNPLIHKIGQNIKFEHTWSLVRLRTEVQGWEWDTMLASHQLDNRPGITGLKFQTYVRFGVIDYSSDVSPYLKSSDGQDANALNQIQKLIQTTEGVRQLLTYGAMDTINTHRLALVQMKELNYDFLPF